MADTHEQHQQRQGHAGPQAAEQQHQVAQSTPGLDAVKAIKATGEQGATAVVNVLREHPEERDAIMTWLHQHQGNSFVQLVTTKQGQIERVLPPGIDVKSVRASVTIPGKRKLAGSWASTVATRAPATVTVEVSHTGVRIWMSPALHVDATWPLQNADILDASVSFADGKAHANVADGHGLGSGMISIKDKIVESITSKLDTVVAGSPLAKPGYEPTQDPDLGGTLDKVMAGFNSLFTADAEPGKKPVLGPSELTDASAGATVTTKGGGQFMQDGNGLSIAPGSELAIAVDGAGNLHDLMDAHTPGEAATAAHVRGVRLNASNMEVIAKGKPIARISSMHLSPGGAITVDGMELLGKARDAQATEAGLSFLVALIAIAGRDGNHAGQVLENARDPKIVDGVTRQMIEKSFTETVHKMVLQYRAAVPGMDLAKILGIG
jgi:hypothetical protein